MLKNVIFAPSINWISPGVGYFDGLGPEAAYFYNEIGLKKVTFELQCRTANPKRPARIWSRSKSTGITRDYRDTTGLKVQNYNKRKLVKLYAGLSYRDLSSIFTFAHPPFPPSSSSSCSFSSSILKRPGRLFAPSTVCQMLRGGS